MVGVRLGEAFYAAPAKQKGKIEGEPIYGWDVGSQRANQPFAHTVVLVGAEKEGKSERVYFVDPDHPSDPNSSPDTRRIFAISYGNLRNNIFSLSYVPLSDRLHTAAIGYAYYNPSFEPTKDASAN
jgi:hypothetical protein